MAEKVEIKENGQTRQEYLLILDAFRRMVYNFENSAEQIDVFDDIITLRASSLIDRALAGLHIDFDHALGILQAKNLHLTQREEAERNTLFAAFDNLIEFAAAEETAMMQELPDTLELEDMEQYESICRKYNETYAESENAQVQHAAMIAAFWIGTSAETIITFNTQSDERVRPWHLSYEGISYPKSEFPRELIPPIEWGCRCFLTAYGFGSVYGATIKPQIKINPVFRESLATGGRIFSEAHPYFQKPLPETVEKIKQRLKEKLCLK